VTLQSIAQPTREEGANDQLEVDGQKIVRLRFEADAARDQLWIWYQFTRQRERYVGSTTPVASSM
jgi:hypothetical protein